MVHNHIVYGGKNWLRPTRKNIQEFYHLLVYVDLTSLNIPLRWVDFTIRKQSRVELVQVDAQLLRLVMIVYSKMRYDDIATRTY